MVLKKNVVKKRRRKYRETAVYVHKKPSIYSTPFTKHF